MGRPRKPTALKLLDGDRRDRIPEGPEPAAEAGLGDAPSWLDRHGRDAWDRLGSAHRVGSLLTRLDAEAAALYCQSYSTYRHALAIISRDMARMVRFDDEPRARAEPRVDADGDAVECRHDDDDDFQPMKPHPMWKVANEAHRQMMRILSKFGMTPSDRAGLHLPTKPEDDELLSFLSRAKPDAKPSRGRPSGRRKVDP